MSPKQMQMFGGDWTEEKLDMLQQYLVAYQKALKSQPFELAYIDAFAGSGYREQREKPEAPPLFPELMEDESQAFLDGSARLALQTHPPFDRYVFIERSQKRFAELERLKAEFPPIAERIEVRQEDCNEALKNICETWNWRGRRAVLFMDPFGMQVDWETVEAVAGTRAVDVWILFPLGIGVNRLLTRSGEIRGSWRKRLDKLFGTPDWFDEFYREELAQPLLNNEKRPRKVADFATIARFYNDRLRSVFAEVADNPKMLYNSRGNPLFLLCFAASNPRGAPIAMRIAQHILRN